MRKIIAWLGRFAALEPVTVYPDAPTGAYVSPHRPLGTVAMTETAKW